MKAFATALPARLRLASPRRVLRGVRLPSLSPRLRRRALIALLLAALFTALYMLVLRDSSFVKVEKVTVTGLTTEDAARLKAALAAEGQNMTTLHVRHDRLEDIVAGYPAVRGLEVDANFPNALSIRVIEWIPVAAVVSGDARVAVGAEGGLLKGVPVPKALPTVELKGAVPEEQLPAGEPRRLVSVLAGAPAALRPKLDNAQREASRGYVVAMEDGPELIFGDMTRLRDKWLAAARVLADPTSKGASYVDLRLPDRPVAGGLPAEQAAPSAAEEAAATPAPDPLAPDPTAPAPDPTATPEAPAPAAEAPAAETPAPVTPAAPVTPEPQAAEPQP